MTNTIHILQSSGSWRDTNKQALSDFRKAFSRAPHLVGFTEVYSDINRLKRAAREAGYGVYYGDKYKVETAIAVREDIPVIDFESQRVHKGQKGEPPSGGHSARNATWVLTDFFGDEVFFVEGHWVTGKTVDRKTKRRLMSVTLAGLMREWGRGDALAFGAGDTNEDDRKNNAGSEVYEPLEEAGIKSCWDDLGIYPPTHIGKSRSTIDMIFRSLADRRVSLQRAQRWERDFSDHYDVSAWYDLAEKRKRPVVHDCPMCNLTHSGILVG